MCSIVTMTTCIKMAHKVPQKERVALAERELRDYGILSCVKDNEVEGYPEVYRNLKQVHLHYQSSLLSLNKTSVDRVTDPCCLLVAS